VNLAACYRLVALYGWTDLVFTHISARVPGPEHHFLINPYGLMFDEITASNLVKVDQQCNKGDQGLKLGPALPHGGSPLTPLCRAIPPRDH
jgi:ribulose-5-phosphate 4-epimerase/fuculose-1-phosphate aldolase